MSGKLRTPARTCSLVAAMILGLSACGSEGTGGSASTVSPAASHSADSSPSTAADPLPSSGIEIRSPMTLSNNLLPGMTRKDMYLRIELTEGAYSEDWRPGAFTGTLYQGRFQAVIADSEGQTLSNTRFDGFFTEPLIFTHHFSLAFDDYNGDGFPDFTLGQRSAGRNGGQYKIFTIGEDLTIRELPVRDTPFLQITNSEEGGSNYSVKLSKSKTGLLSYSYFSQVQAEYIDTTLKWQNGEFVRVGE